MAVSILLRAAGPLVRILVLLALCAPALSAQEGEERSLHWRSLEVEARLDAEGRLHVTERQAMVFSGDWNGGERRFDLLAGQRLRMREIRRLDPAAGASRPLQEGDLDELDRWDREGDTFRWRSRLPEDPPFQGDELVYELEYEVWPVLLRQGEDEYLLSHDFAFANRAGVIERFALRLELDPAWGAPAEFQGRYEATGLAPGRGYAVQLPLRYLAPGVPATVPRGASAPVRAGVLLGLLAGLAWIGARFLRRERASGRLAPLPEAGDEAWLREQVLCWPPEVVGAAWDRSTGSPEVAALLARLTQEGKLSSRVEADDGDDPVLHLRLEAPRDSFTPAERPLIDALFYDGRTETDTESVKRHYKEKGFDPASKIRDGVTEAMAALPGHGRVRRSWGLPVALLLGGVAVLVAAGATHPGDAAGAAASLAMALAPTLILLGVAGVHSKRVVGLGGTAVAMALLLLLMVGALALLAGGAFEASSGPEDAPVLGFYRPGPLLLAGLALVLLGMAALAAQIARPGDTQERLAFRRRLTAAREMLRAELERPEPRLRDEWYPYLLAFGLGPDVDRWFRAHGAEAARSAAPVVLHSGGGATPTSGSPGGWTGGGVAFGGGTGGGGGAGGAWGAAASSMAASVSPPSSGGGGAVSGGGGGGGW